MPSLGLSKYRYCRQRTWWFVRLFVKPCTCPKGSCYPLGYTK